MEKQIMKLLNRGYDIRISDRTALNLGWGIELSERLIAKAGFNPCVPTKDGQSIYYGIIQRINAKTLKKALRDAIKFTKKI